MSENDFISVGDRVSVRFNGIELYGVVLYIPNDIGDSWRIKTDSGRLLYIQKFDYIERSAANLV